VSAPAPLRAVIARDLHPVRPLAPPAIRALALVPVAAATLGAIPLFYFFRPDLPVIGALRAWGFSIIQAAAGIAIVAAALRESVPGRTLSRAALASIFAGGLMLPVAFAGLTANAFDVSPGHAAGIVALFCFRTSAVAALPAVAAAGVLSARALPLRPMVAGALYGFGCGLIADAGLRLWCEFSAPSHIVLAHLGAVAVSTIIGALAAWTLRVCGR
jgi:hypothetical protein